MNQHFLYKSILFISILLLGFSFNEEKVHAQTLDTLEIKAVARSFGDQITVRWIPVGFRMWQLGNQRGYRLERVTLTRNGKRLSIAEQNNSLVQIPTPFKPLPLEEWRPMVDTSDVAGVAAGAIYGEEFGVDVPTGDDAISIYHKSKEQENRFGFSLLAADQSLEVAKAMGLAYTDKHVHAGEEYLYRISPFQEVPNVVVQTGACIMATNDRSALPQPKQLVANFGNKNVRLTWNHSLIAGHYTSFEVEQSADNGQTFRKINRNPVIYTTPSGKNLPTMTYSESLSENKKVYVFRVRGKTHFGEYGPYSSTVQGMGFPPSIAAHPFIYKAVEFPEGQMQIHWRFDKKLRDKVKEFHLYRSEDKHGEYERVSTEFLDGNSKMIADSQPLRAAYYKVVAIDENDYELSSLAKLAQLIDNKPPKPPIDLSGTMDSSGVVKLQWAANTEDDLKGYRVFRSVQEKDGFTQVKGKWIGDTFLTDTVSMKFTNEEVYYRIKAIDFHENNSNFSDVLAVERPDIYAPIAPIFKGLRATEEGVHLQWANSSSRDIVFHQLQRKPEKGIEWEILLDFGVDETIKSYIDKTASNKIMYEYRLLAVDDAELQTFSKIIKSKPIDNHIRAAIEDLEGDADRREKMVQLQWSYPKSDDLSEFVLYRSPKKQAIRTYKVLDVSELNIKEKKGDIVYYFDDKRLKMNTKYQYQLIAKHKDGSSSQLSELIYVAY